MSAQELELSALPIVHMDEIKITRRVSTRNELWVYRVNGRYQGMISRSRNEEIKPRLYWVSIGATTRQSFDTFDAADTYMRGQI